MTHEAIEACDSAIGLRLCLRHRLCLSTRRDGYNPITPLPSSTTPVHAPRARTASELFNSTRPDGQETPCHHCISCGSDAITTRGGTPAGVPLTVAASDIRRRGGDQFATPCGSDRPGQLWIGEGAGNSSKGARDRGRGESSGAPTLQSVGVGPQSGKPGRRGHGDCPGRR